MRNPKPVEDRHFVSALARGLTVLQAFKSGEEQLSNQELAARCNLPKSTITRLTYTLTRLGFLLNETPGGKYRLGLATLTIGGTTLSRLQLRETAKPLLQEFANRTGTMASLAMPDELSMLYIENCRSEASIVTLRLDIGSRLPMAVTAVGRGYLASESQVVRDQLLNRIRQADPANWSQVESGVKQAQSELAELGCVTSFGAWRREINAIAAPLFLGKRLPPMVVNSAAPFKTIPQRAYLADIRPLLIETARAIEERYVSRSGR